MLLSSKGVEEGNEGMRPKMEKMEIPTAIESNSQVDNVVPSNKNIEAHVVAQIAPTNK